MPLTERDPNTNGRASRASNLSATSKPGISRTDAAKPDMLSAAPSVLSMLKTSTETVDIGSLSFNNSRMPTIPRASHQRRSNVSRMSGSSHHSYAGSQVSKRGSNHNGWDSSSIGPRGSMGSFQTAPLYLPNIVSPTLVNVSGALPQMPHGLFVRDGRSYSMTNAPQPPYGLSNHRSLTSLRSQGAPVRTQRSPHVYHTRLKRPGYRPSSPALSDFSGSQRPRHHRPHLPSIRSDFAGAPPRPSQRQGQGSTLQPYSASHTVPYSLNSGHQHGPVESNALPETSRTLRTITPNTDAATQSSDPPSSAPPTPKDGIQDNIAVSIAASEAPALYYDYSEQYEKFVHNTPEPPQTSMGFVQRIKTILEERTATEDTATRSQPHVASDVANVADASGVPHGVQPALSEIVELPASPVVKRITRALITAVTSPSSEKNESSTNDIMTTAIEVKVEVTPSEDSTTSMLSEQSSDVAGAASSEESAKRASTLSDATTTISVSSSPTNGADHALAFSVSGSASTEDSQKVDTVKEEQNTQSAANPISPIQVGDDTTRRSVVSSLPDEPTFDVDESVEPQFALGASLEEPLPTRASKPPLAIHPLPLGSGMVGYSSCPAPLGQRYSNDMTISSEGVTDVAVRFSVPQHTDAGKPQLVTISSEPTSDRSSSAEHKLVETFNPLLPKITLIQPDPVALPPKTYAGSHDNQVTTNSRLSVRKSSARRAPDVEEPESIASRLSRDGTTTDLRFSSLKYPSTHLPGLKEETQDDASTTDLRISSYNFPVPRSSTLKALQERAKHFRDSPSHVGPPKHSSSRPLDEIRDLPSLNFSRMDLITKLNDALEARSSRSLDGVRPRPFSGIYSPVPERPASSDLVRERYKSFFAKEEDFELPIADDVEEGGAQTRGLEDKNAEQDEEKDAEATLDPTRRPLSPEDLITVITEVNRLSVPSVNGLTERLSELLPSLKRYHSEEYLSDDETVQSTIEKIHGLGRVRPRTMMTVRSSGGLRQLAATADLIVMNGTTSRDSTFKDTQDPRLMKELPPLPNNADQVSVLDFRNRESTHGIPRGDTPVAELEAPAPALIRVRSLAADGIADVKLPARDSKLMSSSKRSLIDSSPDARPWNLDANYPWADTTPTIEISMPAPAHYRDSSDPTQRSKGANHDLDRSNAPGSSDYTPDLTSSTDGTFSHARKTSKKSVLGSVKRKVGLRTDLDNSGFATGPEILRPDDRAVEPGDRYPTTGLSPPSALNLAEVQSFFSDDSSHTERGGSFRKRLTHLKTRLPPISRVYSADNGSLLRAANGSAFGDSRIGANSSAHTYDGTMGMSKCEFRAKKVVEKIKHLWFRSGELLRTLSGRSQAHTRRTEPNAWLEDSDMYSGV